MTTTTVSAATGCGSRQRSRPRGSGSIAGQIKDQRRGYAPAVLRAPSPASTKDDPPPKYNACSRTLQKHQLRRCDVR